MSVTNPTLLTPAQASAPDLIPKPPQTIRRMCAAREIECLNISRGKQKARYLISTDAIRAWRRNHTIPALQRRP